MKRNIRLFVLGFAGVGLVSGAGEALAQGYDGVDGPPQLGSPAPTVMQPIPPQPAAPVQVAHWEHLASPHVREGFTAELGIGFGVQTLEPDFELEPGLAPLSLSLGVFLTQDVALLGRISGTVLFDEESTLLAFYGGQLQFWLDDRWIVAVGAGAAAYGETQKTDNDVSWGVGFTVRAGYSLWAGQRNAVRLAVEALPAVIDDRFHHAQMLILEWQAH